MDQNMKKILPIITALLITIIWIGFRQTTQSAENIPYPKIEGDNPPQCLQSTANELVRMRNAWNANLSALTAQEKPASDMVDEAYESMRTYRCWLGYLCQAVLYSANADEKSLKNQDGSEANFGAFLKTQPGCAKAEDVQIPGTKLKFMPHCKVDAGTTTPIALAQTQYDQCQALIQAEFADPSTLSTADSDSKQEHKIGILDADLVKKVKQNSSAFIGLESALKTKSAGQKSRILQEKLNSILLKMQGMEAHINVLSGHMSRFDQKLPCLAAKCD